MPSKIWQNEIIRNILALMGGTSLAQVIPIALQPILRRAYDPQVFGLYSLYLSYIGIVVVISSLRYELSIVIQKEDRKAINLTALAILISFLLNTMILIIGIVFLKPLALFLNFPEGKDFWMLFIPVSAWLLSSYQAMNYWLVRKKAFMVISGNKITRRSCEGVVQTGFGFNNFGPGMIIGDILGNIANVAAGIYQSIRKGFNLREIKYSQIKAVAREQMEFPKFQAFPSLLTSVSISLPVIIVTKHFGILETSYFDLSRMVLLVPSTLIAIAVSQVLFQKLSENINNNLPILGLLIRSSVALTAIAGVIILIMFIAGPFLFGFVFAEEYRISGEYSGILSIAFMSQFIASPISIALTALKKLKVQALWQFSYFLLIVFLLVYRFSRASEFYLAFTAINVIAYAAYWIITLNEVRKYQKGLAG